MLDETIANQQQSQTQQRPGFRFFLLYSGSELKKKTGSVSGFNPTEEAGSDSTDKLDQYMDSILQKKLDPYLDPTLQKKPDPTLQKKNWISIWI